MFAQSSGSDKRYTTGEKFSALTSLAGKESSSFSKTEMERSFHSFRDDSPLDSSAPAVHLPEFNNADILLVGAGSSVREYAADIETFIKDHQPLVLTLNHQAAIDSALVDGIICVDQYRLLYEADYLASCGKAIYTAQRFQDDAVKEKLSNSELREYDCLLQDDCFSALDNGCIIPVPLAFAYALALCLTGKARRLFLVGFDGFDADDSRQHEMLKLLKVVEPHCEGVNITALTPTSYPVSQGSIYASYK
jgi:4-hydroxy 2-oxovalerate aldolase